MFIVVYQESFDIIDILMWWEGWIGTDQRKQVKRSIQMSDNKNLLLNIRIKRKDRFKDVTKLESGGHMPDWMQEEKKTFKILGLLRIYLKAQFQLGGGFARCVAVRDCKKGDAEQSKKGLGLDPGSDLADLVQVYIGT